MEHKLYITVIIKWRVTRYWIEPRYCIFVKGDGFLPFVKNIGESVG